MDDDEVVFSKKGTLLEPCEECLTEIGDAFEPLSEDEMTRVILFDIEDDYTPEIFE